MNLGIVPIALALIALLCSCAPKTPLDPIISYNGRLPSSKVEDKQATPPTTIPEQKIVHRSYCPDSEVSKYLQRKYLAASRSRTMNKQLKPKTRRWQELEALLYATNQTMGDHYSLLTQIPERHDGRIAMWVEYFTSTRGRKDFLTWLTRAQELGPRIKPILEEYGLPKEIFFVAMIESGLSNSAYSRARAAGTWQFMKPTAKHYGLKINHWVDERRDPEKATKAAATYLTHLYRRMGSWHLAMAAYNAGPGRIKRALKKSRTQSYWDLSQTRYIRSETKNYLPKILAARKIAENAEAYGFYQFGQNATSEVLVSVPTSQSLRLRDLAQKLSIPSSKLKSWNPELIRNVTPPDQTLYHVRVPRNLELAFHEAVSLVPKIHLRSIKIYTIRRGDTINHIAKKHKTTTSRILSMNPSVTPKQLTIGTQLAVPMPNNLSNSQL